jgi:hypothetical protein
MTCCNAPAAEIAQAFATKLPDCRLPTYLLTAYLIYLNAAPIFFRSKNGFAS